MGKNKDLLPDNSEKSVKKPLGGLLRDTAAGYCMGVAFIIPGFSGGSVAAILGIYERLVGAIADIFRSFKKSVITLLPIFIGLVLGAVSLIYPLDLALGAFPLPTVCIFVGLALGGLPSLTDKLKGKIVPTNVVAFAAPLLAVIGIAFIPIGAEKNLMELNFGGYLLLFLIGILGSSALVIPGISGSMILLILGYYNPIIDILTEHLLKGEDVGKSLLVLGSVGLGIIIGFIGISVIMKRLLAKFPRGTYFAIVGFIVGSIPTIYATTVKEYYSGSWSALTAEPWWLFLISALLLLVGAAASLSLIIFSRKKSGRTTD